MYDLEGLLKDASERQGLLRSLMASEPESAALPPLRDAKIKLTSKCNLRCVMCDYWKTRTEQTLTTARWQGVLDELLSLGCRKVHFSGGEPFLRSDLLDILRHGTARGLKVNLTTNGTLVSREHARALVKSGVNSVSVSLDGPTASLHDRIRGREGAFKLAVKTVRRLVEGAERYNKRLKVRINFVIQHENLRRLPEMVQLAGELGAMDLIPMPVDAEQDLERRPSRRQIEHYNLELAPQVRELRERFGFALSPARIHPFGSSKEDSRHAKLGLHARGYYETGLCHVPWLHAFFAWNGDASLCCMSSGEMKPLGNVGKDSVATVFGGVAYRKVRAAFLAGRHLPACHRCDMFLAENQLLQERLAPEVAGPPRPSHDSHEEAART